MRFSLTGQGVLLSIFSIQLDIQLTRHSIHKSELKFTHHIINLHTWLATSVDIISANLLLIGSLPLFIIFKTALVTNFFGSAAASLGKLIFIAAIRLP